MPTLIDFITRVVPWPADGPGYVNLHWKMRDRKDPKREFWAGKVNTTPAGLVSVVNWALSRPASIRDIYFCLSLQAKTKERDDGSKGVARHSDDALALKAIWLDVDIKNPPKGYKDLTEAVGAVQAFVDAVGLPSPSALIGSGGGLHVYWISDKPLMPEEWKPYAEGLKAAALSRGLRCDAGVTSDAARVLRVPGTFNYKTDPPKPVKILGMSTADYDFKTALSVLLSIAPVTAPVMAPAAIDMSAFAGKKPAAAFAGLPVESLSLGLERADMAPLDPKPIMKECAFFRDALLTGGKDYSQPMWMLTTLGATWMENGNALAHKLGSQHPGYTRESTEAMWLRKISDRKSRSIGWPSCSAIQAAGCSKCTACPHLAKGKSPLNLSTTAVLNTSVPLQVDPNQLPYGYVLNQDGYICMVETVEEKGQPPCEVLHPLFTCKLSMPWTQRDPDAINFVTTVDKGNSRHVTIGLVECATTQELVRSLLRQGVKPYPQNELKLKGFIMAWTTLLHNAQASLQTTPFGWYTPDVKAGERATRRGFVYGGVLMKDDGTDHPAGFGDKALRKQYNPRGDLTAWIEACNMVTDQKRPELDIIIASAFAAPLMVTPGEYSVMLSVWGHTGSHKSTARKVAAAVWGHPKLSSEGPFSTPRSVLKRMGEIKNLPLYWDEIKDEKQEMAVYDTYFVAGEGAEGNRLNRNAEIRDDRGSWQTLITICSNHSFVDRIVQVQKGTAAGMYRCFEVYIDKDQIQHGHMKSYDATRITQELENNYGMMGMKYAKMLAADPYGIDAEVHAILDDFSALVKHTDEERFWISICGVLLAGATYANRLGANLDIKAMKPFLVDAFLKMRAREINEGMEGGTTDNTEQAMANYLRDMIAHQVYTDRVPMGVGKPKAVTVLAGPPAHMPRPIYIQWAVAERQLRISRKNLVDYLMEKKYSSAQIMNALRTHMKAAIVPKATLASGTGYECIREVLLVIPVPPGSVFEPMMNAHGVTADPAAPVPDPAASAPVELAKKPKFDMVNAPISEMPQRAMQQAQADLDLVRKVA